MRTWFRILKKEPTVGGDNKEPPGKGWQGAQRLIKPTRGRATCVWFDFCELQVQNAMESNRQGKQRKKGCAGRPERMKMEDEPAYHEAGEISTRKMPKEEAGNVLIEKNGPGEERDFPPTIR